MTAPALDELRRQPEGDTVSDNSTDARPANTAGTRGTRERIGTIGDLMRRYSIDAGDAWSIIARAAPIANPDGDLVLVVANPDEREGTTWIIYEEAQ